MKYDHLVNVVKLHAHYLFTNFIWVRYCEYLLKLKDNTMVTTLQASSKTAACTEGCGPKLVWS